MRVLALDASTDRTSVTLLSEQGVLAEATELGVTRASAVLVPLVRRVLREAGLAMRDVERIAVARGPGSFTGMRIAMATAKGIASALELPLFAPSTLDALTLGADVEGLVLPLLDARRGEFFAQLDEVRGPSPDSLTAIEPAALRPWAGFDAWLDSLRDRNVRVAVDLQPPEVMARLAGVPHVVCAAPLSRAVARLALRDLRCLHGEGVEPLYLRAPDAKLPSTPLDVARDTPPVRP